MKFEKENKYFETVVCQMVAILFRPRFVNSFWPSDTLQWVNIQESNFISKNEQYTRTI